MRIIIHVDMDAFFAACEERYNPQFRGKPLVVGADPKSGSGRGVVSTANYPARKYGIRSAMPIAQAWRLAESARRRGEAHTIFLAGNRRLYAEVSDRIMEILAHGADAFEEASIDEAYLDISSLASFERAVGHAHELKAKILKQEGLTSSVGIGPNKLVAKIASDFKKPDGLTVVYPERVEGFLRPLPIRAIPGIGPKGEAFLHTKGIQKVADLQMISLVDLTEWFGQWGQELFQKARGVSEGQVSNEGEPKSIGEQETFEQDTLQAAFILERARLLGESIVRRLLANNFRSFQRVVITVRFADFVTKTRSHTFPKPETRPEALHGEVLRLILPFLDARENPRRKKIRLIGVRIEKLSS